MGPTESGASCRRISSSGSKLTSINRAKAVTIRPYMTGRCYEPDTGGAVDQIDVRGTLMCDELKRRPLLWIWAQHVSDTVGFENSPERWMGA